MSFVFNEKYYYTENITLIKLKGIYEPEISFIEPINKNTNIGMCIISSIEKINGIRNEMRNLKTPYLKTLFNTPDGVTVRNVLKGTSIGKTGNIEGNSTNYFRKIVLTQDKDINDLSIVLDSHYTFNFASNIIIKQEFIKDINNFSKNIEDYLSLNINNKICLYFDYELYRHIVENIIENEKIKFFDYIIDCLKLKPINLNKVTIVINKNNKKNYIQKHLCETYFGVQIAVNTKGVLAELKIPDIIYYWSPNISVGHIKNRNILSINCNTTEKITFEIYLFILNENVQYNIEYKGEMLNAEEGDITKIYRFVDFKELKRVLIFLNKIIDTNINFNEKKKLIQEFNPYLYKFDDFPLFTVPKNELLKNELDYLIYYVFETIDNLEYNRSNKKNKNNNVMFSVLPNSINDSSNDFVESDSEDNNNIFGFGFNNKNCNFNGFNPKQLMSNIK
jgi:hypothetical protein